MGMKFPTAEHCWLNVAWWNSTDLYLIFLCKRVVRCKISLLVAVSHGTARQPDRGGFLKLWEIHIMPCTKCLIHNKRLILYFVGFFAWKSLRLSKLPDKQTQDVAWSMVSVNPSHLPTLSVFGDTYYPCECVASSSIKVNVVLWVRWPRGPRCKGRCSCRRLSSPCN